MEKATVNKNSKPGNRKYLPSKEGLSLVILSKYYPYNFLKIKITQL